MNEISAQLKSFLQTASKNWEEESRRAKSDPGFERLDDGRYIGRLTNATLGESKSSGRPQITFEWTILEGDSAGSTVRDYRGLDHDMGLFFLGKLLLLFGIDPETVVWDPKKSTDSNFIVNILDHLVAEKYVAKLKLKTDAKDFQAVTIEQIIDDYDSDDDEEDEGIDLRVGMLVEFAKNGSLIVGVVKEIDEENGTVKISANQKTNTVSVDAIVRIVDAELD